MNLESLMEAYDPGEWYTPLETEVLMMTATLTVLNAVTHEPYQAYRQEFIVQPSDYSVAELALLKTNAEKSARLAIVRALLGAQMAHTLLVPLGDWTP
jgi:hypothetical protein